MDRPIPQLNLDDFRKAAIDPRHLLIDRIYSDNIKTVNLKE